MKMASKCQKIALVGIAKMENDYVNEWIRYHLNLGFDWVFLYDNNDSSYEYVGDRIDLELKDRVTIIPFETKGTTTQENAYTDCYIKYGDMFDWMAFFDIDEFLVLDGIDWKIQLGNISADNVLIPWKVYTWNNRFSRNIDNSVMNDFTEFTTKDSDFVKSFVKTKLPYIKFINVHAQYKAKTYSDIMGNVLEPTVPHPSGNGMTRTKFSQFSNMGGCRLAVLNHYWSKSLDEFIKFKLQRGYLNPTQQVKVKRLLSYCNSKDVDKVLEYLGKFIEYDGKN